MAFARRYYFDKKIFAALDTYGYGTFEVDPREGNVPNVGDEGVLDGYEDLGLGQRNVRVIAKQEVAYGKIDLVLTLVS